MVVTIRAVLDYPKVAVVELMSNHSWTYAVEKEGGVNYDQVRLTSAIYITCSVCGYRTSLLDSDNWILTCPE